MPHSLRRPVAYPQTKQAVERMLTGPSPDPVTQWMRDQINKATEQLKSHGES